jgi:hypothetical protein
MVMYQEPPARFSAPIARKKAAHPLTSYERHMTPAAGRDTATGNTREPEGAEVAVLPWVDQALHAGSRRSLPPPAQAFRSGVVVGSVHADRLLRTWCRLPDHL